MRRKFNMLGQNLPITFNKRSKYRYPMLGRGPGAQRLQDVGPHSPALERSGLPPAQHKRHRKAQKAWLSQSTKKGLPESGRFPKIDKIDRPITHGRRGKMQENGYASEQQNLVSTNCKACDPGLGFSENNVGIRSLCLHMPKELDFVQQEHNHWNLVKCWNYQTKFNCLPKEKNLQCSAI